MQGKMTPVGSTHSTQADYYFELRRQGFESELAELVKYQNAHRLLIQNDWFFVSPLFFQGFDLHILSDLYKRGNVTKQEVNKVIFRKFFNLECSAAFIEGYCKQTKFVEPFLTSIEHSLILAYQRDFEGATKTLVPIVEGILRIYLVEQKGITPTRISFKTLKRAVEYLKQDLLEACRCNLADHRGFNNEKVELTDLQVEELMKLRMEMDNIWFSFLGEFINESFYRDTDETSTANHINRHSILHALNPSHVYNLEGFIKVYFVIYFLTWMFIRLEDKSPFSQVGGYRHFEKVNAYRRIIESAEKMAYDKHILLKEYAGYDAQALRYGHRAIFAENLSLRHRVVYKLFVAMDEFLWRRGMQ